MNTNHPSTGTPGHMTNDSMAGRGDRAAHPALDAIASGVGQVRSHAGPALQELASEAGQLARSGASTVREQALIARDASAGYVRGHPLQTVLMAAGVGAAIVLLVRMLSHRGGASR